MRYISVVIEQDVARITLDAPPGNRINFQMREELEQAVDLDDSRWCCGAVIG
jgi:enoyl-CoA hydratase/carnithine racemase